MVTAIFLWQFPYTRRLSCSWRGGVVLAWAKLPIYAVGVQERASSCRLLPR